MKLKVGDKVTPKYKGHIITEYEVKGIAKLTQPAVYEDDTMGGEVNFNPTIILLESTADGLESFGFPIGLQPPELKGKSDKMRRGLTTKQEAILEAIRIEMSSGKSLDEAAREVMRSNRFNHMTMRRCVEKLARDRSNLNKWVSEGTK